MARSLRLTKAERDFLKKALGTAMDWSHWGTKTVKTAAGLLAKVEASEERAPGINVEPLEQALMRAARGKVVALEGGFDRASRQAGSVKASEELMVTVGEWMARQSWLTGPMTILDVLNKWYQWVPKAKATQPPPGLAPGLGASAVQGQDQEAGGKPPVAGSQSSTGPRRGRSLPGLR